MLPLKWPLKQSKLWEGPLKWPKIMFLWKAVLVWKLETVIVSQFGSCFYECILPLSPCLNSLICKVSNLDNILSKTDFSTLRFYGIYLKVTLSFTFLAIPWMKITNPHTHTWIKEKSKFLILTHTHTQNTSCKVKKGRNNIAPIR